MATVRLPVRMAVGDGPVVEIGVIEVEPTGDTGIALRRREARRMLAAALRELANEFDHDQAAEDRTTEQE